MQEHEHVKTIPGEPVAPEIVPNAVQIEPGEEAQAENINIPMVAISVIFFAAFLTVAIVGLQAWFYNTKHAEIAAMQAPEGGPNTPLGDQLAQYNRELYDGGLNDRPGYSEGKRITRIPIDAAMTDIVQRYAMHGSSESKK